jgi:hypothetical protein
VENGDWDGDRDVGSGEDEHEDEHEKGAEAGLNPVPVLLCWWCAGNRSFDDGERIVVEGEEEEEEEEEEYDEEEYAEEDEVEEEECRADLGGSHELRWCWCGIIDTDGALLAMSLGAELSGKGAVCGTRVVVGLLPAARCMRRACRRCSLKSR